MGQSSRQKILECAQEMFHQVGYEPTSVDEILRRCGVVRSNFYYHFKSKEELAVAVLERQEQELEPVLDLLRDRAQEPPYRLHRFIEAMRAAQEDTLHFAGCPFGSFAAALSTQEDAGTLRFRAQLCSIFLNIETALTVCMEEGIEQGQFRRDIAPDEMARFVVAALEGLMILTRANQKSAPLERGALVLHKLLAPQ